jgi:hypothetical protein
MAWMAAVVPLITGAIGQEQAGADRKHSMDILNSYAAQINALPIPDAEKMKLALNQFQSAGKLDPRMIQATQMGGHSAFEDINIDPRLKTAQNLQLSALQKMAGTPLNAQEMAQRNMMRRATEADAQSRAQQQLEDQQRRGLGSSEAGLVARLIGSQASANRASEQADALAAAAEQRSLGATAQAGSLAGQMQAAEWGQQAQVAGSKEQRALQDFLSTSQANQNNVQAFNQANATNLEKDQARMNANTQLQHQTAMNNQMLTQQEYENRLKKLGLQGGAASSMSGAYGNQAASTAASYAGMGQGISQGIYGATQPTKAPAGNTYNVYNTQAQPKDNEPNWSGSGSDPKNWEQS